jgi:hypothetical protein
MSSHRVHQFRGYNQRTEHIASKFYELEDGTIASDTLDGKIRMDGSGLVLTKVRAVWCTESSRKS